MSKEVENTTQEAFRLGYETGYAKCCAEIRVLTRQLEQKEKHLRTVEAMLLEMYSASSDV